jgi:hypothetical protein
MFVGRVCANPGQIASIQTMTVMTQIVVSQYAPFVLLKNKKNKNKK